MLNHNFFSTWTPEMAYFVGFIAADGCLFQAGPNSYRICIGIHSKDKYILESLSKLVNHNGNIYTDKRNISVLAIYSTQIFQDLQAIGLTPRKSLTMKWMDTIPKQYMSHYIRGFFDGDGCVFLIKHPSQTHKYIGVNFTGTKDYLEGLQKELNKVLEKELGHIRTLKIKAGEYYQLVYSGNLTIKILLDWMYKDSTPETRLVRKYQIYNDFYSQNNGLIPHRNIISPSTDKHDTYMLSAFGEKKTLSEWSKDSRCVVSRITLYHRIMKMGWDIEKSLILRTEDVDHPAPPIKQGSLTNEIAAEIRKIKKEQNLTNSQLADQFSTTVNIVNDLILNRIYKDEDYDIIRRKSENVLKFEYNGKEYTLKELSELSGVPYSTIDRRIREGKTISESLKTERIFNGKAPSSRDIQAKELATKIRTLYSEGKRQTEICELLNIKESKYKDVIGNRTNQEDKIWWK